MDSQAPILPYGVPPISPATKRGNLGFYLASVAPIAACPALALSLHFDGPPADPIWAAPVIVSCMAIAVIGSIAGTIAAIQGLIRGTQQPRWAIGGLVLCITQLALSVGIPVVRWVM